MKNSVLFLVIVVSLSGCFMKKKKVDELNTGATVVLDSKKSKEVISNMEAAKFNFNFLAAKAKVQIESNNKTNSISFNIRMKKDEKIWISVTALGGIEVARALLTVDSVKIMDKINAKYIAADYDYISEIIKNEVNFTTVQNILIGNYSQEYLSGSPVIKGNKEIVEISGKVNDTRSYLLFSRKDFKLNEMRLSDTILNQKMEILYGDFRLVNDQVFPFLINSFATSEKESVKLNVQYSKVEKVENLEFPFSVPKKYE
jgi:hypothetical protein